MKINEVMTRDAKCIAPSATVQEAAERMKELDVGSLPICDNDKLIGMITDRDITIRCVCEGHDPGTDTVRDVMTSEVFFCFDDDDIADAAEQMRAKQVRRLPVLNRDKRLVGIVSLGDLALEAGDDELVGHALEGISEPAAMPH